MQNACLPPSRSLALRLATRRLPPSRKRGFVFQIGVAPVRIDNLMSVSGLSFVEAWNNRTAIDFDGLPVWVMLCRI